jgi:hypothetical protein
MATPLVTSNTIGQVQFSTRLLLDHAFRGCRLAPQQISGEYIQTALDSLALMLSAWANEGVPLWCQTKYILPLVQGVYQLAVANTFPGVVDILEANLRYCHRFTGLYTATQGTAANAFDSNVETDCTQTTAGGSITLQLATAANTDNVGIMSAVTGTIGFMLQYSNDGTNWTTFYENDALAVQAGVFWWMDFQGLPQQLYWRLQADDSTILNIAELFFGNHAQEIPVSRINKDDYWNLPDKTFQGRPVQYWCDRQVAGPVMWLWPSPGRFFVFHQITVLAHRHIMDVGTVQTGAMNQVLELPQRAYDAVWMSLSERLRMIIPEVDKQATADLPAVAKAARMLFWGEERDDSPVFLQLDIGSYTR